MIESGEWHINTFSIGVERDIEPELAYANPGTGTYYDARNARPLSIEGTSGIIQKIKGEAIAYPNSTSLTNYQCTAGIAVGNHLVDIWMPIGGIGNGIIRVDGVIVLSSASFILDLNQVQFDVNNSNLATEIYLTDNTVPPYIFDINDMVSSLTSDPNKYFLNFDPLLYQINLQSPLDSLVFVDLKAVGGGGGLPVGQYRYQMRYSNDEGDRTNWSIATPMIPVVESTSSQSSIFPYVKTYGGPPNPSSVTGYAPRLRFRVTNIYNYQYIEIKRIAYNQGAGIDFAPNGVIVAKLGVSPGEISVREYLDPSNSNTNIALSEADETQQLAEIQSAKTIRYFDRRIVLMNVKVASKQSNLTFLNINGKQGFPVIDNLDIAGYNDPWNHAYRRSFMRGEDYSFGVELFDGVGTKGFVEKIPDLQSYQMPNRRDTIATETNNYSYFGTVKAADTSVGTVSQTHEVFDIPLITHKDDVCSFKNVTRSGILSLSATKTFAKVAGSSSDCQESTGEVEQHGAHVTLAQLVTTYYHPFTPVRQNDPDVTGHNYVTNVAVYTGSSSEDSETGYRPKGFAPTYYAMGMMVAGVDNFPKWAKAFSVVRTNAAERVVCQGLGYYSMKPGVFNIPAGNQSLASKDQNKFWFYSPDIQAGNISSQTVNDMIANPQNYSLQFVSPLGFYSEVFGFKAAPANINNQRDRLIDMISYVRMIKDNDSINPGEDPSMGVAPGDGYNYVAYDKYRNTGQNPNYFGLRGGNTIIDIAQVSRISEGRGTYLSIQTNDSIYGSGTTGGTGHNHFEDQGMKDWTEPIYIINIVRTGDVVRDQNIEGFKQTTHYQKLESIIGKGNGNPDQKFILVDERWEDCIPAPNSSLYGASTPRFLYIKHTNGVVDTWVNVTYMSQSTISTISTNITQFGFDTVGGVVVKGIYTHENILNQNRFYNVVFNQPGFYPAQGDLILVRYDNTAPIRVYGGDAFIGEAIFAPIDREANSKDSEAETQFTFGIGLPYHRWKLNPRYYIIRDSATTVNMIQDNIRPRLGYLRQLCAMFTCETRCGLHYAYNADYPNQFYPLINYVIRPDNWDYSKNTTDNHIWNTYDSDYPNESGQWKYGGFRFLQQVNPDYSCEPPIEFFSRPEYGFVERTNFDTGIMFSLQRVINVQNSPSLKTFPANNFFVIDDNQGEIKYAWDATTEKGENLYAFTNKGVCLLITNKNILSDQNGSQLGYMSGQFIQQQYWISKDVGMFDEFWRSAAQGHVPLPAGEDNESERTVQALFFANNKSVYKFMENTLIDIGRAGYYSKVYQQGIKNVQAGFGSKICAIYNEPYKEYWLYIKDVPSSTDNMFVYGKKRNRWHGTFDYKFDKFTVLNNVTYGFRNAEAWKLDVGYTINSSPIQFEVITAVAKEQNWDKEFMRIRVNTIDNIKPTRVEFYKDASLVQQCFLDATPQGQYYMKDYHGYEQLIPRTDVSVNPKQPRLQWRIIFYKVIHNLASEFKIVDSSIKYKKIKGGQ